MFSRTTLSPSTRISGMLLVLLTLILLAACTETSGDRDASLPPPLYPQPRTFDLKAGVPIPATPKIIHPDSVAKPQSFIVDQAALTTINTQSNRRQIPKERTTIPVDKSQLEIIKVGEGNPDFVLLNSVGDTIPTGVPVPAKGNVVKATHSKPTKALPPATKDAAIIHLQYLNVEHGMASSFVRSVLEDKSGNIWMGTRGGVSVFNGESFTHYTENEGLSNNFVRAIVEDQSGNIWLGTEGGGVSVFDGESFTHYTEKEGFTNNLVRAILEDKSGNIWLGTRGGVSLFDGESFTHFTEKEGLSYGDIMSIAEDQSGNIWFGTFYGGVSVFDGESFTHYNENEGLSNSNVVSILEDQSGNIWLGTDGGGVSVFNGESFTHYTEKEGVSSRFVWSILEDKNGNIWLGTRGGGVSIFNGESFTHYTENEGLSNNTVYSITEDQSGNIWLGTEGGGVNVFNGENFSLYTENMSVSNNTVRAVLEDQNGNIWVGTEGDGVSVFNEESSTHYTENDGLSYHTVVSILEDRNGNIWLGTEGGGVSIFNGVSFTHYTENEGLSNNFVRAIAEDRNGNIWLGSRGRVSVFNGENFTHYINKEGVSNSVVWSILEDRNGNIWLGTEGGGVSVFNGESFTHYTKTQGLSNNNVRTIAEDKNGNIWLGTWGGGVSIFNGESFIHFTENEGLSNNTVFSIIEDKSAPLNEVIVYVGTENGLSKISLKEDETSADEEFAFSIQNFDKQNGLKSLLFTTGATIDSKNRAWWGTDNGLVVLDLNTLTFSDKIPKPRLSHLEINEQFIDYRTISESPYSDQDQITFSGVQKFENYPLNLESAYEKNHLTFYFAAIDWAAPHKIRYSYRMEGLHANWSQPAADPMADYRNLPFGTYSFQIRAIGESGVWSEPFDYSFTILPPWWHTWWAYVFYGVIFLNAIYLLRRYELNRFNLKNQLAYEKIETESLRKLDHLKSHFFANISHEFRTPLTLILGQIETLQSSNINGKFKDKLKVAEHNGRRLLILINQLLELSKLEAGKIELKTEIHNIVSFLKSLFYSFETLAETKNISLSFVSKYQNIPARFDTDQMEKVFCNLLSNAFKFTRAGGGIEITISKPDADTIIISLKDSGIGIAPDRLPHIFDRFYQADVSDIREHEGTGIGLALVQEYITLHEGKISVFSKEDEGTEFIVEIPCGLTPVDMSRIPELAEPVYPKNGTKDLCAYEPEKVKNGYLPVVSVNDEIILIVDDNTDVRTFIREQLEKDYKIIEASNGKEGLEASQSIIPNLIISDLMMPEMNGYSFCKKIRENEKTSHIPIIMLTAKAGLDDKIEGLETGIDAYLTKPFRVKELKVRVSTLIQRRKDLQKRFSTATLITPAEVTTDHIDQTFLENTIQVIEIHLGDDGFSSNLLADSLNMSISQLNRKLNALIGQPAGKLVQTYRLQRASEMLKNTDQTVAEISYKIGFSDQAYFSRIFKKQFGKSPSKYRK